MIKDIVMILGGILGGCLLVIIRNKVFASAKQEIVKVIPEEDKIKIKDLYEKGLVPEKIYKEICTTPSPTECFSTVKAINGLTNVKSSVLWMKDIASIFNLRKLIIVGVILGVIFGYGYWKGVNGVRPILDLHGKEEWIRLNEHYLHIVADGSMYVVDKDQKTILKTIKVKDIPSLQRALKPYGFKLEPIVVAGGSLGESGPGIEGGAGVSWLKYFKWNLDSFITTRGLYPLGVSYQLTNNSGIGLGAGAGYKGDRRTIVYYKWKF